MEISSNKHKNSKNDVHLRHDWNLNFLYSYITSGRTNKLWEKENVHVGKSGYTARGFLSK